jgi:hypothetical protein
MLAGRPILGWSGRKGDPDADSNRSATDRPHGGAPLGPGSGSRAAGAPGTGCRNRAGRRARGLDGPRQDGRLSAHPPELRGAVGKHHRRGARIRAEAAVRGHHPSPRPAPQPPVGRGGLRPEDAAVLLRRQDLHHLRPAEQLLRQRPRAGHAARGGHGGGGEIRHRPAAGRPLPLGGRPGAPRGDSRGDLRRTVSTGRSGSRRGTPRCRASW